LLGALAHVHACGVAHGDIKPDNILVRDLSVMRDSEVRIVTDVAGELEFVRFGPEGTVTPARATLPSGLSSSKSPCEDAYKSAKSMLPAVAGSIPGGDAGDSIHLLPRIALADFGHSVVVAHAPLGTTFAYQGTPQYRAPEVRAGARIADPFAADLWAAGMTLLVHLCGGLMFDSALLRSRSPSELQRGRMLMAALLQEFTHPFIMAAPLEHVAAAQQAGFIECSMLEVERLRKHWMAQVSSVIYRDITYRPVRSDAPAGAVDLVLRCLLQRDPEARLPARELMSHQWLVGMLDPLAVSQGLLLETDAFSIAATNSTVSDTHSVASSASGIKRSRVASLEESGIAPSPKRGRHSPLMVAYAVSC
jgi:serine/threonine protein kinase